MAKLEKITKKYSKSINRDRQIWSFATELTISVEVNTKEELLHESQKLFKQAKALTDQDILASESEWVKKV